MRRRTEKFIYMALTAALIATLGFMGSVELATAPVPERTTKHRTAVPAPEPPRPPIQPIPQMRPELKEFKRTIDKEMAWIPIETTIYEYEYIGTYFITAYCACKECCGWDTGITASGETVHRANEINRKSQPTTAAIDPSLHSFGDLIYVPSEDRIYICEDTGSAVKGHHIDLYQDDHEAVQGYNTRYEDLYSVTTRTILEPAGTYDIHKYINQREDTQHDFKRSDKES